MAKANRDEFTEKTKQQIAKRAGWLCSDPSCRRHTIGSNSDGDGEINLGIAAHICAAAPGGPRYDPTMTPEQRRSPENGIWMCQLHGKAVDAKDSTFTKDLLHEWKEKAQKDSWLRVLYNQGVQQGLVDQGLSKDELSARFHAAAAADLNVFQRSDKWPSTSIALTLEIDGLNDPVSTSALATALATLDDLVLVAPPGMGKTTTLFQIAEAVIANSHSVPIIIPLGDWSADGVSLLESVLKRPAFRGITEDQLRTVASKPGVILLLDGWNELGKDSRKRAAVQLERLQLELPEVSLLISTRKQALDVPVNGKRVNLLPLDEMQQLDIARAIRGEAGERIIDQAWRTTGVRELITIPLYLTSLLALPEESPFPATKEEILRQFIGVHEENNYCIVALEDVTFGLHQRFLEDLAVTATRVANTTLSESIARKSISGTDDELVAEGLITEKPQPNLVLEALVSHHLLVRDNDLSSYSFQHQQFLEWYASHMVERLMLLSVGCEKSLEALKSDVLNLPVWEESILFACERLARGVQPQLEACCSAILEAFTVDPILAAEMVYRSTEAVWVRIGPTIQGLVRQWHKSGKVDRALGFMIASGRPEFLDQVWPLITHEDDQIHLSALRLGRRFRPSILGSDAVKRLTELPPKIRKNVLLEIASNSGMDGLDLVAAVAKSDPDSEIKAAVVNEFAWRCADRHITDVLKGADNKTFDLLAQNDLIDNLKDDAIKTRLSAARERRCKEGMSAYDKLYSLVYGRGDIDRSTELATVIAEIEIHNRQNGTVNLIYEAAKCFPRAVADGILRRLQEGRTLPYRASELISELSLEFVEDSDLCEIALEADCIDERANAAASALGTKSVGRIIDKMFDAMNQIHDTNGNYDKAAADHYHILLNRIGYTKAPCLLAAIEARSAQANNQKIVALADLISRHPRGENRRGRPFDSGALATIAEFIEDWGNRLLASDDVTRRQLASIATLACHAPSAALLPLLKRLLDEELRRWRAFKEQANADQYRGGLATNEARSSWTLQYQRAFHAINCAETKALMREYLLNEDFGHSAALVLAEQWRDVNEPSDTNIWKSEPNFSRVTEKRAARLSDPSASSEEADAIFTAIERLIGEEPTETMRKHAITLAIVATALPRGRRDDTIKAIITLADRYQRCLLLTNLVLSGELLDIELIKHGIAEVFESAQKQPWILTERHELRDWLCLLPFSNRSIDTFDIVQALPKEHRTSESLEKMLDALGHAPDDDAENTLFRLAEADSRLYASHAWRNAVSCRGTLTAMMCFVNLAAQGVFNGKSGEDHWRISTLLAGFIGEQPELRSYVYDLLRNAPNSPGLVLLAKSVAETPDADGLLLLIQIEIEQKRAFVSWRTIERIVTQHVPTENWGGAYNVVAAPAVELRRKLLAMTTDGGPGDSAARCLNTIDQIRDEYGIPETELRHPDLGSGKAWPILINR